MIKNTFIQILCFKSRKLREIFPDSDEFHQSFSLYRAKSDSIFFKTEVNRRFEGCMLCVYVCSLYPSYVILKNTMCVINDLTNTNTNHTIQCVI